MRFQDGRKDVEDDERPSTSAYVLGGPSDVITKPKSDDDLREPRSGNYTRVMIIA